MDTKNRNTFMIYGAFCIVILLMIVFFDFNFLVKGTRAYFGDGTTGSFNSHNVHYYSNYPDSTTNVEPVTNNQNRNMYKILDNMFEVPIGYEFIGWKDLNGKEYSASEVTMLTADLQLYAQWSEVVLEDDNTISYGDVNLNGEIDSDDYLLIESHIAGTMLLVDQALNNADVNVDGKVDLVDVDIIKNAYLGTRGYVGYLPDNPILIYDIYEGNIDIGNGDISDSDSTGDDNSSGSDAGTGDTGNGNGSGGSSQGGSHGSASGSNSGGSSGGNKGGNSSSNKVDKNDKEEEDVDKETSDVKEEPIIYEFKFMNEQIEYTKTKCEASENGECELVLPSDNPSKVGYTFKGWSKNKDCPSDSLVNATIIVSSSDTYYACFKVNEDINEEKDNSYVWIVVFAIILFASKLIWNLISRFKEENSENNN